MTYVLDPDRGLVTKTTLDRTGEFDAFILAPSERPNLIWLHPATAIVLGMDPKTLHLFQDENGVVWIKSP